MLVLSSIRKLVLYFIGFAVGCSICQKLITKKSYKFLQSKPAVGFDIPHENSTAYDETLENQLSNEVRILCMIMTYPANHKTRAVHVKNTWGKRCTKLLFITSGEDSELDTIFIAVENDTKKALRRKARGALLYAYQHHFDDFDWFMKADDDAYVIMENLRYLLYQYNTQTSLFFGHRYAFNRSDVEEGYMAGFSYILSKKALMKFNKITTEKDTNFFWPDGPAEDLEVGRALKYEAIFVDCRDDLHQKRFFPVMLADHINGNKSDWYMQRLYYNVTYGSLDCCSDVAISFHYIKPDMMYLIEYLVYRVHPFGVEKAFSETLPRKLNLDEIIAASDAKSDSLVYIRHEPKHNIDPSEIY